MAFYLSIYNRMSKKDTEINDDFALFKDAVQGVKKLRQDTIVQQPKRNTKQKRNHTPSP